MIINYIYSYNKPILYILIFHSLFILIDNLTLYFTWNKDI